MPYTAKRIRYIVALLFTLTVLAHAEPDTCKALRHATVPASAIGMPTTGATITSASHHSKGGQPFCKLLGRIHPVDPAAQDIRFELNLPDHWNTKALQYGGGTFDGYLAAAGGLRKTALGLSSAPIPLEQGYATFGSDSGHHKNCFPLPDAINAANAQFARNREMQMNFAGDQLKKVHDTASALITRHYGKPPTRMYFIGGSTGGREALRVAQRFPSDYDGVLAAYAVWNQVELDLQLIRTAQALYAPGGFIGIGKASLIQRTVLNACDAADGLKDGIVSNPGACHVDPAILRCHDGKSHHGCLSDAQLHTLITYATPSKTSTPMTDGNDTMQGYNVLSGASMTLATGLLPFALPNPIFFFNSFGYVIGDDVLRNFLDVGHHYDCRKFDTVTQGRWHDEVLRQAADIDSTNPDLQPFFAHGGKLILVHGTNDLVVPTNSSVDYYTRLKAAVGDDATAKNARLYIIPGLGHGDGRFNAGFDTIGTLDAWADKGIAPANLVTTDNHSGRTRPLCAYPAYPRYNGNGDPNLASSFACAQP